MTVGLPPTVIVKGYISSSECKKVVTDNLVKTSFYFCQKIKFKKKSHKSKYLQPYDRNTISKNNEKQRKLEHKMASHQKLQKCR